LGLREVARCQGRNTENAAQKLLKTFITFQA
jgi:hypothetical protein